MKTVIRADANHAIGVGHFTRCMTLARELISGGHEVEFQSQCEIPELIRNARENGIVVTELSPDNSGVTSTRSGTRHDWVVLDGYHFTTPAYKSALETSDKLLIIDDAPRNTEYPADLVLDQNYGAENHRYPVPNSAALLGTNYALIRPKITALRENSLSRQRSEISTIVVTFGGSDPAGATEKTVAALSEIKSRKSTKLEITVVAGPANTQIPLLESLCASADFNLLVNPPNLPEILAKSDLAICATGTTVWELMCLGVPILALTIADNQVPAAKALQHDGLIGYLGQTETLSTADLSNKIIEQLANPDKLARMATHASKQVDGNGPSRVVAAMLNLTNNDENTGTKSSQ